jgi:hypothetical protein
VVFKKNKLNYLNKAASAAPGASVSRARRSAVRARRGRASASAPVGACLGVAAWRLCCCRAGRLGARAARRARPSFLAVAWEDREGRQKRRLRGGAHR